MPNDRREASSPVAISATNRINRFAADATDQRHQLVALGRIDRVEGGDHGFAALILIVDPFADLGHVPFGIVSFASLGGLQHARQHRGELLGFANLSQSVHRGRADFAVARRWSRR